MDNIYDNNTQKSSIKKMQILSLTPKTSMLSATLAVVITSVDKKYGIWGRVKNIKNHFASGPSQIKFSWLRSTEDDEFMIFDSIESAKIAAKKYENMIKTLFNNTAIFEYRILPKK